ncbi:LysR family transcriptional regulator [Kaistia dalseonensis]|uniref:DNA-binding transcriptional LysR family regulator n=1 Tax=Kaistia dalseonensis TaxID=410840 RepID=A0ABU0HDT2_9HYPH|nr:LysR family transcriptional regulator [Kaistia dalseonensis]MCX5497473.1 LysR family transcriptional regulator [Kaistia dalseonensis]MDQ0440112.1 DNA-binding transcriptional LysR family regulator [Kaistia dalseonensis]
MINRERFEGIAAFVETAEAGSFTRAAARLGLTRSAVGKSIARLEARLAVRLFNRTTRSLSLTDEGARFRESCLRILAELDAAEDSLAARRAEPAGLVRIDLPVLFGRQWVVPLLLELSAQHPGLEFDVNFSNRVADLTAEGIDLGVRIGALDDAAGLIARRLGTQTTILCAARTYLDRHGRPGGIEDLAGHAFILERARGGSAPWRLTDTSGKARNVTVRGRLAFDRSDAIADAVLAGHGIGRLPGWLVATALRAGTIETVLPGFSSDEMPIHALWPAPRALPLKVRVVVDALVARFQPVAPWDDPGMHHGP